MRLSDGDEVAFCIDSEPTSCIADVWVDEEGAEAHAHLIAAAPELLQALRNTLAILIVAPHLLTEADAVAEVEKMYRDAKAAIAKAEPV